MKKILLFVMLLAQFIELTLAQSQTQTFHKIDLTTFTMHRKGDTLCFVHPVTVDNAKCSDCYGTRNQIIYTKFVVDSTGLNDNEFCKRLYGLPNFSMPNPNGVSKEVTVPYTSQLGAFGTEITTTPSVIYYRNAAVMKQIPKITKTEVWCFHTQFLLVGLFLIAFFFTGRKEWTDEGDRVNVIVSMLVSLGSVIIVPLLLLFFWLLNDYTYQSEPKIWVACLAINLLVNLSTALFLSGALERGGKVMGLKHYDRQFLGFWNITISYLLLLGVYYGFVMDATKVISVVIVSFKILVLVWIIRLAIKWVPVLWTRIKHQMAGPKVAIK